MMIDWARVADLRDEIGTEDFGEVVELFFEEVDDVIAILRSECAGAALEAKLHFLKGYAMNLGFRRFAELCQQGENAAGAGDFEQVDLCARLASYALSKVEFIAGLPQLGRQ